MEGYPVQEEPQPSQMESVLVKLQLELQQQLQPPNLDAAAGDLPSPQLLIARLAPTSAAGDDVTPQRDDVTPGVDDATTDSMHSEITLRQSVGSVEATHGAGAADSTAVDDATTAEAICAALTSSIASLAGASTPAAAAAEGEALDEPQPATPAVTAGASAAAETPADAAAADTVDTTAVAAAVEVVTPSEPAVTPGASRTASERCLSGTEDEWHMVSRGGSVKAASSTGRYSFDAAEGDHASLAAAAAAAAAGGDCDGSSGATSPPVALSAALSGSMSPFNDAAAVSAAVSLSGVSLQSGDDGGSECGSDATPRDELAASILGHPVMVAAAAAAAAAATGSNDDADATMGDTTMSAAAAAAVVAEAAAAAAGEVTAAAAEGEQQQPAAAAASSSGGCEGDESSSLMLDAGEALSLLSGGLLSLAGGLREWLVESLAALVQTGRDGQAACLARAGAALRALQLGAKESGGLAAAAAAAVGDWRLLLSSAAAVVCLALWVKSRKEASMLRMMLRRRDHELSKLVMRVVSLQELINQGGHLQPSISRYSRFEGATVTTTYM